MKMKAAVLRETGAKRPYATSQPIQIEEIDIDPPQPGELLVKIAGGGLCHSDLSVINGNRARPIGGPGQEVVRIRPTTGNRVARKRRRNGQDEIRNSDSEH